jgi:DNA-binding transcriptional MerR regulator
LTVELSRSILPLVSTSRRRAEWKLAELAAQAGVPPRTVRYYVQRGLLPAPDFRGPDTAYGEEHLWRLKAIRQLQARFLPLDAIQAELGRLTPEGVRALAEAPLPPSGTLAAPLPPAGAPPPTRMEPPGVPLTYQRWELAPGLELHLSSAADAATRALAERLRALAGGADPKERGP